MPLEIQFGFFLTAVLLALTPGPDNIFVLSQSLAFGRRAGIIIVLGLCSGLVIHTLLVALGVAAMIAASPQLFTLLKIIGALYLVYLAWLSWQSTARARLSGPGSSLTSVQLYRRGFVMNVSNPKVIIFFLAFLPQFIDYRYGEEFWQVINLGILFMLSTLLVFGGIALLAGRYSRYLNQSEQKRVLLNRLIAIIFILIAGNLLLTGI